MIPFIRNVQDRQIRQIVVTKGWRKGKWGVMVNRYGVPFVSGGNVLKF